MSGETLAAIGLVGLFCLLLPIDLVVVTSMLVTFLADTKIVPQGFIYWVRFRSRCRAGLPDNGYPVEVEAACHVVVHQGVVLLCRAGGRVEPLLGGTGGHLPAVGVLLSCSGRLRSRDSDLLREQAQDAASNMAHGNTNERIGGLQFRFLETSDHPLDRHGIRAPARHLQEPEHPRPGGHGDVLPSQLPLAAGTECPFARPIHTGQHHRRHYVAPVRFAGLNPRVHGRHPDHALVGLASVGQKNVFVDVGSRGHLGHLCCR